jgi:copper chaperone
MNGIENINVDLKTQIVKVAYNQTEINPHDIRKKISSMGYEVIQ